jgi:hypothetical protein
VSYYDYQAAKAQMPAKTAPAATYRAVRSEYAANQALRTMVRK